MTRPAQALAWAHGVVSVESLGGMLGPTVFVLPNGQQVSPFQIAPWAAEPGGEELPGILRRLRGEWPCVPFGSDSDRPSSGDWPGSTAAPTVDASPHGFSANHEWTIEPAGADRLSLAIAYPEAHPIERLERRIIPDSGAAALDFELTIVARRDCLLPIGLHPVMRLPALAGAFEIELPVASPAMTFPGEVDSSAIFAPGQYAESWRAVRLRDGTIRDPSRLPFAEDTEDLLQLLSPGGTVSLWNRAEGYRTRLSWNTDHFPSLMFWFSNRGRKMPPWSGRHLALGVEPVCSAFDLGPQISAAANPVSARGTRTAQKFMAGERFSTRYRLELEPASRG